MQSNVVASSQLYQFNFKLVKINTLSWAPVAHACNPSYWGDRDQEDCCLKPAQANSPQDPISKVPNTKWAGGVAQGTGPEFIDR
jgi:hypothetical protein